jgi:dimethylhistidine N-methyltransferase
MVALARTAVLVAEPRLERSAFAADVRAGLRHKPKQLKPKYFYDSTGSNLFERITELPEYYPTRCEMMILAARADAIAALVPKGACLIEFGSGSTAKIRILLRGAQSVLARKLSAYVPVDISAEMLAQEAAQLRADFPRLAVLPLAADISQWFDLPPAVAALPRAGFFPGSTIGNFEPHEAQSFLRLAGRILGPGSVLAVGFDLVKPEAILNAAYNDAAGVTAQFNLNLLVRINRELGGDFDLAAFAHRASYNHELQRIEMHLVSQRRQTVRVCGERIAFARGETIHTENSYKYTPDSFAALARASGWSVVTAWTDPNGYFSVHALRRDA